jgi:hypothetical protein
MCTVPIEPQESCAAADCLAGLQHPNGKGFKHQCETAVLAGPWHLDGFDTVLRAIDPELRATRTVSNCMVSECRHRRSGAGMEFEELLSSRVRPSER